MKIPKPDRSMEEAFNSRRIHPLEFDRRPQEPWNKRWQRLFGVNPGMEEKKRLANAKNTRMESPPVRPERYNRHDL